MQPEIGLYLVTYMYNQLDGFLGSILNDLRRYQLQHEDENNFNKQCIAEKKNKTVITSKM